MGLMRLTVRTTENIATAATAAAGAATGATVGAVLGTVGGAVSGALRGIRSGAVTGARSQPAAVAGLAALGAGGLVEWPAVIALGGSAMILRQLRRAGVPLPAPPQRSTAAEAPVTSEATGTPAPTASERPAGPRDTAATQRPTHL
jgi:hypothetical protein